MSNIFLSIPVMDKPELRMINSLYKAIQTSKHKVYTCFSENESLIQRARNSHISSFINDFIDFEYFMSIDSDIEILNCNKDNNIFNKLIDSDKDFIGGLYSLKNPNNIICSSIPVEKNKLEYNTGLVEMKWLSSGCWLLKRETAIKMANHYKELMYNGDGNESNKIIYGLYNPEIIEILQNDIKVRKLLSEDWIFCKRWTDLGNKIFADTTIVLNHIGKYQYKMWDFK